MHQKMALPPLFESIALTFPKINESTVRGFKKHYEGELHRAKKMGREVSKKLPIEKQGRPRLLGDTLDTLVQKHIRAQSNRGNVVTRSMAVSTAKVLMRCYPKGVGKVDIENSEWAKSLFKKSNNCEIANAPSLYKENELLFHHQIVETVETYGIPNSMIVNFDQTPCKYVPVPTTTLAERNSKQVAIKGIDDKRAITATFTITLDGNFLGMQLIYGGKTNQSLPRYQFRKEFSLSINLKYYSNDNESLNLIDQIILPYLMRERERLNRPTPKALVIFDSLKVK